MTETRNIGQRRNASAAQAPASVLEALRKLPTALLSDNMQGLLGTGVLRPFHRSGRMAGTAVTVRVRAGDNLVLHRALDHVRKGDVLYVIEPFDFEVTVRSNRATPSPLTQPK